MKIIHEYSDAWLLLGIIYASNYGKIDASLQMIIGCCDYIEHSIISYHELKGGFYRLIKNNYIKDIGDLSFKPSDDLLNKYNENIGNKKRTYVHKELEFITNLIGSKKNEQNYDFKKVNKRFRYKNLTEDKVEIAYKKYLKIVK
jgi:hypothetical protein